MSFFFDKYLQSNNKGKSASFNHFEMITVPQELFSVDSGTVFFYLCIDRNENGIQKVSINYLFFDYTTEDGMVIIRNVNLNR